MHSPISLKPISKALIAAYAREGVRVGPASGPELIVSTFGLWSGKLAVEHGTPFVLADATQMTPDLPPHMHLRWTIERIKKIVKVDDWKAQQLAAITIDLVRKAGLRIDAQAVLFDRRHESMRARILKALVDPNFPPVHASAAIGADLLPCPPTSLGAHFELIGPDRPMGPGGYGTVVETVARDAAYLWATPSRELREADSAFTDRFEMRNGKPHSASLGLGFCLVLPFIGIDRARSQNYALFSPALHYRQPGPLWRTSGIASSTYREADTVARGGPALADIIGVPVTSLPRADVCPACMSVFVRGPGIAEHHCDASGPDARHIVSFLRGRFDAGRTSFTTDDLLSDAHAPRGRNGRVVSRDVLDNFLYTHRLTLKLRQFEHTWTVMRRPTIDLEPRATQEVSEHHAGA